MDAFQRLNSGCDVNAVAGKPAAKGVRLPQLKLSQIPLYIAYPPVIM